MSECFVSQTKPEYRREDGALYYSPIGGGAYGHRECLEKYFGPHVEKSNGEVQRGEASAGTMGWKIVNDKRKEK
jgi:hypothetical protein